MFRFRLFASSLALATVFVTAIGSAQMPSQSLAPTPGDAALAAGDFDGAASAYSATLARSPTPAAELGLGTIEMYRNHLAVAPHLQRARSLLAAIQRRTGSPGDYRIAFSKVPARLPFAAMDPLPTLRAKINGRPVKLWIDTGADGIDLDAAAATRLHLATKVAGEGIFAGGQKAQIRTARVERIDLPGVTVRGITGNTVPAGALPEGIDGNDRLHAPRADSAPGCRLGCVPALGPALRGDNNADVACRRPFHLRSRTGQQRSRCAL